VPTWDTKYSQGSEYNFDIGIVEDPSRAIRQLRNLASGHALSHGRHYITLKDIPMLVNVVLSTCSLARATIFQLLLAHKGTLTTSDIVKSLNVAKPTALRTMTELKATGLVDMNEGVGYHNSETEIVLSEKFKWFLTEEFMDLVDCKEKNPPRGALNPILLSTYYDTINKNKFNYGNLINSQEGTRGVHNSLQSNLEDIPQESWKGRVKEDSEQDSH